MYGVKLACQITPTLSQFLVDCSGLPDCMYAEACMRRVRWMVRDRQAIYILAYYLLAM